MLTASITRGGNVGFATKGLQLFFPISPRHLLCIYDDWVYKIGDKSNDIIELSNKDDIEKLNYLQALNCLDHLYFNHLVTEVYIKKLYTNAKNKRMIEYTNFEVSSVTKNNEGSENIQFHSYDNNIEVQLDLSFITQTKKAKKHILSNYVVQLRDEKLRNMHRSSSLSAVHKVPI